MERIKTIATRDLTKSVVTGGCGYHFQSGMEVT